MAKVFLTGVQANNELLSGVNKVANAIRLAIGPDGSNSIIGRPYQTPLITSDGKDIANSIELDNEIEQLAKESLDDVLDRAERVLGNGRKTTTILFQEIVNEGAKQLVKKLGVIPKTKRQIHKEINESVEKAISLLEPKQISKLKDIESVASIAIKDNVLGKGIAKVFDEFGKDVAIQIEDSAGTEVEFVTIKGFEINAGHPSYHYNEHGDCFVAVNPYILMTNKPLSSLTEVENLIAPKERDERPFIILGEYFSKEFINHCVETSTSTILKIIPIKVPSFSDVEVFKDYSALLGVDFVDKDTGNLEEAQFGTCDKMVITNDKTSFLGIKGDTKERVKEVKKKLKDTTSAYEKDTLSKRLYKLSGGACLIKVGGHSEQEKSFIVRKLNDGIRSTRHALENGIVKGSGLALKEVAEKMGESIISEALRAPYIQIQKNAGNTLEIGDDVTDAFQVVKESLIIASSLANLFLTLDIAIADKREKKEDLNEEEINR